MFLTHYVVFAVASVMLFPLAPPRWAAAVICLGGWLLLPIGHLAYAPSEETFFTFWITGVGLPGWTRVSKFWVAPVTALLAALVWDRGTLARFRPGFLDVAMLAWCLWPLAQAAVVGRADPPGWISSLYLFGSWGASWLLGRTYFGDGEGRSALIGAMAMSALLLAPIAIIEGLGRPQAYAWLYHLHPFRADGVERYVGFRPVAFFEHGNQYGVWIAAAAVAAVAWAQGPSGIVIRLARVALAVGAVAVAVAGQSVGALCLMLAALALLAIRGVPFLAFLVPPVLLSVVIAAGWYVSGGALEAMIARPELGQAVAELVGAYDRQSLIWRMHHDEDARQVIAHHFWVGSATADPVAWEGKQRPWGFILLAAGQAGVIGVALAIVALTAPALRILLNPARYRGGGGQAIVLGLAAIVLVGVGDMLFNSFILYPAIAAAGAIARRRTVASPVAEDENRAAEYRIGAPA